MTRSIPLCLAILLAGCGDVTARVQCPDLSSVAPASIGGAAYVRGLSERLAGPDRENTVTEAVAEIERRGPRLGSDAITNILIAADCPNAAARPNRSEAADRARTAEFRAQVQQILGN
jgi:hypothetical protein